MWSLPFALYRRKENGLNLKIIIDNEKNIIDTLFINGVSRADYG